MTSRGLIFVLRIALTFVFVQSVMAENQTETKKSHPSIIHNRFNHMRHVERIPPDQFQCQRCHPFSSDTDQKSIRLDSEMKGLLIIEPEPMCHDCHRDVSRARPSLFQCNLCHSNVQEIIPDDHKAGWLKKHGQMQTDANSCQQCHKPSECIDCHRRYESMNPRYHSRNYKFFHSIEARMNPGQCSSCHKQSQCRDCHRTGEPLR